MIQQSQLGIYLHKTIIQKYICTPMFTVALFTIAKTWKQPTVHKWIKVWYTFIQWYITQP